ncbi:MAG: hypothetical protein LBG28_11170, partial [Tannerella sp.]|nr:hypothetical protein [Tannerella sp.]
ETPYGKVKSGWKRENAKIKYCFEIPFGAVARIKTGSEEKIVPSGKYEFEK